MVSKHICLSLAANLGSGIGASTMLIYADPHPSWHLTPDTFLHLKSNSG
jgi:hypothetical protein